MNGILEEHLITLYVEILQTVKLVLVALRVAHAELVGIL